MIKLHAKKARHKPEQLIGEPQDENTQNGRANTMPEPRPNETKKHYISRAIAYMIREEGLSQEHAAGKAYGMWDQMKKKARRRANAG